MILSFILNIFYIFITFVFGLLPVGDNLPTAFADGFRYLFGFLWNFDFLVSVSNVIVILSLTVGFQAAVLLFRLVSWVIHLIRGK